MNGIRKTMLTRISCLLIIIGAIFLFVFALSPSALLPDGELVEPFFLLPVGWLLILLGSVGLVASAARRVLKR